MQGFLSIDIDISELQVNQCDAPKYLYEYQIVRSGKSIAVDEVFNQMDAFHTSHKCHLDSMQVRVILLLFDIKKNFNSFFSPHTVRLSASIYFNENW